MRPGYEKVAEGLHHDQGNEGDGLCTVDKIVEAYSVIDEAALVAGSPLVKGQENLAGCEPSVKVEVQEEEEHRDDGLQGTQKEVAEG